MIFPLSRGIYLYTLWLFLYRYSSIQCSVDVSVSITAEGLTLASYICFPLYGHGRFFGNTAWGTPGNRNTHSILGCFGRAQCNLHLLSPTSSAWGPYHPQPESLRPRPATHCPALPCLAMSIHASSCLPAAPLLTVGPCLLFYLLLLTPFLLFSSSLHYYTFSLPPSRFAQLLNSPPYNPIDLFYSVHLSLSLSYLS